MTSEVNESFVFNKELTAEFSISFFQGVQLEKDSGHPFTLGMLREKEVKDLETPPWDGGEAAAAVA